MAGDLDIGDGLSEGLQFVAAVAFIGAVLAGGYALLERLRAELPHTLATSAAGNGELYTRKVEEGYRAFWRRYCAANG